MNSEIGALSKPKLKLDNPGDFPREETPVSRKDRARFVNELPVSSEGLKGSKALRGRDTRGLSPFRPRSGN